MAYVTRQGDSKGTSKQSNEFFDEQWGIYQKILNNNYMSHRECYDILHRFLVANFRKPYALLDLGCGDASFTIRCLLSTSITAYTGIDLSAAALEIARDNMTGLTCQKAFYQADLFEFIPALANKESQGFDAILASFALHHLTWQQKKLLLRQLLQLLRADGVVLLIDVFRNEGEARHAYLERYLNNVRNHWSRLTPQDYQTVSEHITLNDLPESQSAWWSLAHTHGFNRLECLYENPRNATGFLVFYR